MMPPHSLRLSMLRSAADVCSSCCAPTMRAPRDGFAAICVAQ